MLFLGVPEVEDTLLLPDLGQSREITQEDVLNQAQGVTLETSQDPVITEEDLDATDVLLSLQNVQNVLTLMN